MKKTLKAVSIITGILIVSLFLLLLLIFCGDINQYKRIGETHFYLVESFATSKDGKPLANLHYEFNNEKTPGEGVGIKGFPKCISWNEDYMIIICSDNNQKVLTNYCIIQLNKMDIYKSIIHEYENEKDFELAKKSFGLDEAKMKHTDAHIPWSLHLFE